MCVECGDTVYPDDDERVIVRYKGTQYRFHRVCMGGWFSDLLLNLNSNKSRTERR